MRVFFMNNSRVETLVRELDLKPHPEGGYYKEVYRAKGEIPETSLPGYDGARNFATSIYFLLTKENFSAFHTIRQDELWHHYEGDALEVHVLTKDGLHQVINLGKELEAGQQPQGVVYGGDVFGSRVAEGGEYALVGCTVAPGFDFKDFQLDEREQLLSSYPKYSQIINELTRG